MFTIKDLTVFKSKSKNKFYKIDDLSSFIIGTWNIENNDREFKLTIIYSDPKKTYFGGDSKRIQQEYTLVKPESRKEKHELIIEKFNTFLNTNKYDILKLILE